MWKSLSWTCWSWIKCFGSCSTSVAACSPFLLSSGKWAQQLQDYILVLEEVVPLQIAAGHCSCGHYTWDWPSRVMFWTLSFPHLDKQKNPSDSAMNRSRNMTYKEPVQEPNSGLHLSKSKFYLNWHIYLYLYTSFSINI